MALSNGSMKSHADPNDLAAFVEGRLPEGERATLVAHLAACRDCRATLAAYGRGAAAPRRQASLRPWLPIAAILVMSVGLGLMVWRAEGPQAPAPAPPDSPPRPPAAATSPPPVAPAPPAAATGREDVSVRRSGLRRVGDKTFQLVAGEWVDRAFDPLALLPVEEVVGDEARAALILRVPALAKYAALGPKVVVVHDKTVYRFQP